MSQLVKSYFVLVKDVRERGLKYVKDVLTSDYKFVVSFPTNAIPILPDVSYPDALRKRTGNDIASLKTSSIGLSIGKL